MRVVVPDLLTDVEAEVDLAPEVLVSNVVGSDGNQVGPGHP